MAKRTAPTSSPTDAPPLVYDRVELDFVAAEMRAAQKRSPKGGSPATLFLGAGLSKSAGIPLANEFVERILRDDHFKTRFPGRKAATDPDGDGTVLTYPECMKKLTPTERRDVIGPFMEEATLNRAHLAIAQLMKHGYVDRILTVNFDPLLVKACALVGEFPAVYDLATAQDFAPQLMHRKAICYLHGQALGAFLVNTGDEGDKQAKRLAPLLHDTFRDRFVLVAGYSGENDPLLAAFETAEAFERHLVWTCYEKEPGTHLKTLLQHDDHQTRFTHALPSQNADTFFVDLADKLGCWPPTVLSKPLGYLREALNLVREGQRLKEPLERVLNTAERVWEEEGVQALLDVISNLVNERFVEAEQLGRQGFATYAGKHIERAFRELTAWTLMERTYNGPPQNLIDACEEALKTSPNMPEAFYNWGNALMQRADAEPDMRTEHLSAAIDKFEQAVAVKPGFYGALNNWGSALGKRADGEPDMRAEHLKAAIDKFRQALDINPTDYEALLNLGLSFKKLAGVDSSHRIEHLQSALHYYDQAAKITSDIYITAFSLGSLLGLLAVEDPERRIEYLNLASEKFAHAARIDADQNDVFNMWGITLIFLAEETDNILLLDEAEQKLQKADKIAPGHSENAFKILAKIRAQITSEPATPEEPAPASPKRRRAKKDAG